MLGRPWIRVCMLGVMLATAASLAGRHFAPRALEQSTQEFNEHAGSSASLETLEYETGLLESRAVSRLTHGARSFLVEHRIEHAPWTAIQRSAVVGVTSWIWNEEQGARGTDDAPVAELRTRILLPELVYVDFTVTPDVLQSGPARWKELTGHIGGRGAKQRAELEVVDLVLGGDVRVSKLRLAADFEVRGDQIEVLGVTSHVEDLAGPGGQVERIELKLAERPGIDLLGYDFRFEVHRMTTPGGKLDTMVIDVGLDNILPEIRSAFESGAPPAAADLTALLEKAARSSPALTLRELRMKGHQQGVPLDLDVRGSVAIDGARVPKALSPAALLECVDADLELRISQDVLASALRMQPGSKLQLVDARLITEPLVLGGYFERDGAHLRATLRMRGSKSVQLNGQSMDPAIRQLVSLTDQVPRRSQPSSPPLDPGAPWQPDGAGNAQLDEMRRQMGLK